MPKKGQKVKKTVVTVVKKQKASKKKGSSGKKTGARGGGLRVGPFGTVDHSTQRDFVLALTAPDITGPIRIPRSGGAQRTALAMDSSTEYLGSTGAYSAFRAGNAYTGLGVGTLYSAATTSSTWSSLSNTSPGVQYPPSTNMTDVNLVGICIVVSYVGAPLNVTGELLIGTVPDSSAVSGSTWNTMAYYPGVVRVPISTLITEGPLRVYGKKTSPQSNNFVATSAAIEDTELPFVAVSLTAAANVVMLNITRTWEFRSTIAASNAVPYARTTESFSRDENMYNDALALISEVPSTVMEGYGEYFREAALGALGNYLAPALINGAALAQGLAGHHARRIGHNFVQRVGGRGILHGGEL